MREVRGPARDRNRRPLPEQVPPAADRPGRHAGAAAADPITTASHPAEPVRISWVEAPAKNLGRERGRVRRIAVLTEDGRQVNVLAGRRHPDIRPAERLFWTLLRRYC